jgi:putative ABC transport system permease protein
MLAWWLMRSASAMRLPIDIPIVLDLALDGRVLLFSIVLSLMTAVMFGLVPALQATKVDLAGILKDSASASQRRSVRLRSALIVVQVAVSLVLLTGAGLMWRALGRTQTMALGFSTKGALEVSFDLRLQGYSPDNWREIQRRLIDSVRVLPGITHAALADVVPIDLHFGRGRVYAEESAAERDVRTPVAYMSRITPGYFRMMGTRFEEGRDFTEFDNQDSRLVVIVNRSLASRLWPGQSALGRRMGIGRVMGFGTPGSQASSPDIFEVVGIVEDGKYGGFNDNHPPAVYRPLFQSYSGATSVVARTDGDIGAAIAAVRGAVREIDPNMPIGAARSFEERQSVPLLPARVTALALAGFGALALVLAAIGLYGVMSYSVSSRTHEIGIRMTLGAQPGDVLRLIYGQGSRLVGVGVLIGVVLALLGTRLMRALLFGISPTDPLTYFAVVVGLSAVALLACWIPARRALKTDPVEALRIS